MSDAMQGWLRQFVSEPGFVSKYRYYAAVLARMVPIEDGRVEVMAVSLRGRSVYLHVNVDFFVRDLQYLRGVLLHEVHHVVLGHLSDPKFRGAAHPDLMELAMEISANEYIREPLPGHPPRWADYQAAGVAEGQSTLERYELLVRARQQGRDLSGWRCVDAHLPGGVGGALPDGAALDPSAYVRVRRLVGEAVAEAQAAGVPGGRLAGREPGRLLEELEGGEEEPRRFMDWKTALQMFVAQLRAPVHTYTRPNRRFPKLVGVVPGRVYSAREAERPALLVAIDTSGSMTSEELNEIARQLRALDELADFTVAECDTVIHRTYPFEGSLPDVAGRGGTDLRPVFEAGFLAEHRPDGVVYFTDGEGPYPAEEPGVRTLWVLTKPWEFGCEWGQKAHLGRE